MSQIILTNAILESLRTSNGGYDRRTLSLIGVGWPPYKKWKKKLVGTTIDSAILDLAKRSSVDMVNDSDILYHSKRTYGQKNRDFISYPNEESKFEIQSFIYSSLKKHFDIRGDVLSDCKPVDLIIFFDKQPEMIITILRENEIFSNYHLPVRVVRNMKQAKELVEELTLKKLGLD